MSRGQTLTLDERGDLTESLVPIATRFAFAVREKGTYEIAAILAEVGPENMAAFAVVLAAMIDIDRDVESLLYWVTFDEHGRNVPVNVTGVRRVFSPPPRLSPERWTQDTVLAGHAAWVRGERNGLSQAAEREYQRRRHHNRRQAASRQGATLDLIESEDTSAQQG